MIPSPSSGTSRGTSAQARAQDKLRPDAARARSVLPLAGNPRREEYDPLAPQREAALFYGLFLRGHSADSLRRDIDVPQQLQDKLLKRHSKELGVQSRLNRAYMYRKQVLAIFDELITRQRIKERVH
jgi:hypothetical protein